MSRSVPRRLRARFVVASWALLAVATSAAPARAQDAQQQAMGRALFNDGVALYNKGDYEAACPKFEASLRSFPGIGTRGKLAECYEKLGRFASAWQAYREVARLAMQSGEPAREQIASARATALESKLSYLTVTVPPANDVPGLVVKRNGHEIERAKLGAAEPIDAGTVTLEVSAPGKKTLTTQVPVPQAQSQRYEVPALEAATPVTPSAAGTDAVPITDEPPPTIHGDPPQWQKPLGFTLIAVGVVGIGVGSGLGLSAKSKYDGAFSGGGCDTASKSCNQAGQSQVDDARSQATVSTILFAAGGGLAAIGAVMVLIAPSSRPRAWHVIPTMFAGGGAVSVSWAPPLASRAVP